MQRGDSIMKVLKLEDENMYSVSKEHSKRLPFVRIRKIELKNFKGVVHGMIDFNCAKEFVPYNTKSDILGLYGQNGSGKSSLVEAISMVKGVMCGYKMASSWISMIDVEADWAEIVIGFDFQYENGVCSIAEYSMKLVRQERKKADVSEEDSEDDDKYTIGIREEIIRTNMYATGEIGRMHPIIDTKKNLFCSQVFEKEYFENYNSGIKDELTYLKRKCFEDSRSFVFSEEVEKLLGKKTKKSKYFEILSELDLFASYFLYVISTHTSGLVQLRAGIPIYIPMLNRPLILNERKPISKETYSYVEEAIEKINLVLCTIIPDLQLELKGIPTVMKDGEDGIYINILSVRGTRKYPFSYEADGIIKIVSILADYIFAFNQGSATLVIDEFDSGVFEYLLGELLQIFESDGKGQFIFTSHNLRPLEVIDKKFIRFTTYDPYNRYYKLKSIGNTNNLRDMYLREVQLGKQDVEMYKRTKAFKIVKALTKAGEENAIDG